MLFMGIDIGTQGVRAVVSDETGNIVAGKSVPFAKLNESDVAGHYEQRPEVWWKAAVDSLQVCVAELKKNGYKASDIFSVAIDGTSATMLPVDENGNALTNALMYNDQRAVEETDKVRSVAGEHEAKMGLRFNRSFALPRVLWFKENRPDIYEKAWKIIHQTDYMVGRLCGQYGVSDYSDSLKTGYDLLDNKWPDFFGKLGISTEKLPKIIAPGAPIAKISAMAAEQTGLSRDTLVVAGATDGYASALAAGACRVGDWASIIGTTLVLKGVSQSIVIDPTGSSYCHKLPAGTWMVGGASNVGGRCLNARFPHADYAAMDAQARKITPTGVLIYPLTAKGERYPFVDPEADEFIVGNVSDEHILYTALMEGVGYTERLAYELNQHMGLTVGPQVFTSGGACKSDVWLQIRANILNRTLKVPAVVDAAMGMVLVAAGSHFGSLEEAAGQLLRFVKTVEPDREAAARYDELYYRFEAECHKQFNMA